MSSKKWSRKSTYTLEDNLNEEGIDICPNSIGKLLKEGGYSLRSNRKSIAETYHPHRDKQFQIISEEKSRFEDSGQPIISVDGKKKELIGNYKNAGRTWCKEPVEVLNHDFRSQALGIASPYGIYELLTNLGTVIVGTSNDTPEFAVESIELWLNNFGWDRYKNIKELLILCDSGGSNGARPRMWKFALYKKICKKYGLKINVCHYPSGASKWNPADHRLFSFISLNWQGRPLRSFELMLEYIRSTKTKKGLRVDALLNKKLYEKGIKVTDDQMNEINLIRHDIIPQWNYIIQP